MDAISHDIHSLPILERQYAQPHEIINSASLDQFLDGSIFHEEGWTNPTEITFATSNDRGTQCIFTRHIRPLPGSRSLPLQV